MSSWTRMAAGGHHTLLLDSEGRVWALGQGDSGKLGLGHLVDTATPSLVNLPPPGFAHDISGGAAHSLILDTSGHVWAMGRGDEGQLGLGTPGSEMPPGFSVSSPALVPTLVHVVAIAAGVSFSLALDSEGQAYLFGSLPVDELSGFPGFFTAAPVWVEGSGSPLPPFVKIAAGATHALALTAEGQVWALGPAGGGSEPGGISFSLVEGLSSVVHIAAGAGFSVALSSDGIVWTWGEGRLGQLGDGSFSSRLTPAPIPGLSGTAITCGYSHALVITDDGQVLGWGYNRYAELGDGGSLVPPEGYRGTHPWECHPTPVQVEGLTGIAAISAGAHHSVALHSDGVVYGWGSGRFGQLGEVSPSGVDINERVVTTPKVITTQPEGV